MSDKKIAVEEFLEKYKHHNTVAKSLLKIVKNWDKDTLKFVRTILPQTDKNSVNRLLDDNELKKHNMQFPNGITLLVDLQELRRTPVFEKAVDMEALKKLGNSSSDAITKRDGDTSVTDSLYKISLLFSVLATECLLFTPISKCKNGLFDVPVQSASGLNLELLELLTDDISDRVHPQPAKDVDLTGAIKVQAVICDAKNLVDISVAVKELAPKCGLNQPVELTDNSSENDIKVYEINAFRAGKISLGIEHLLDLTYIMLKNDYSPEKLLAYNQILSTIMYARNYSFAGTSNYILIKPVEMVLPLKLAVGITTMEENDIFKELSKDTPVEHQKKSKRDLVATIYNATQIAAEVPYDIAVSYLEKTQGFESGYVDAMISKAKQMFYARLAVDSSMQQVGIQNTTSIHTIPDIQAGSDNVYQFAIRAVYDDNNNLDIAKMKEISNLLMENPYKIEIVYGKANKCRKAN